MIDYMSPTNHVFQEDVDEGKDPAVCALCSFPRDFHPGETIVYSPTVFCPMCGEVHPV